MLPTCSQDLRGDASADATLRGTLGEAPWAIAQKLTAAEPVALQELLALSIADAKGLLQHLGALAMALRHPSLSGKAEEAKLAIFVRMLVTVITSEGGTIEGLPDLGNFWPCPPEPMRAKVQEDWLGTLSPGQLIAEFHEACPPIASMPPCMLLLHMTVEHGTVMRLLYLHAARRWLFIVELG